jgi:hypothetical protein
MKKVPSTDVQLQNGPGPKIRPRVERIEADGETHRRDCECPRCEAGFTPSDHERDVAHRRAAEKQGRAAAARAWERKKERARLAQLELATYFRKGNAAADAEVARLREVRGRVLADRRLEELLRLRREGFPLGAALAEIDRRFPPDDASGAENDNARGTDPDVPSRMPRAHSGELFS